MLATILPRACPADIDDAARFVREMIEDRADRLVAWDAARRADGTLRGAVAVSEGRREAELWVVADPAEDDPESWFTAALDRVVSSKALTGLSSVVDPQHDFVRDELLARGFGVAKIHLEGEVETGLRTLGDPRAPEGIYFAPAGETDVDAIAASRVRFFRRHQVRCFGAAEIDDAMFSRIEASQRSMVEAGVAADTLWSVRRTDDDGLVGSFGLTVHDDHPLFGSIAGVDLNLDDAQVGRGLSRPMYATMLRRARDLGVQRYRGTTWNPAVLHLAVPMERWIAGWFLRDDGPFVEDLPEALRRQSAHV